MQICDIYMCMEVRTCRHFLVARASYDVKGAALGHSLFVFIGWQACGMLEELNISGWIQAQ